MANKLRKRTGKIPHNFKDYTGQVFGSLTASKRVERVGRHTIWEFNCECGQVYRGDIGGIVNGKRISCGCAKGKAVEKSKFNYSRTYNAWRDMRQRCKNPKDAQYARYGGRGIHVAAEWDNYLQFLTDMGECPPNHYLDRIDNDGSYVPLNCRWVTAKESASNRSTNSKLTLDGITKTLKEWSEHFNVSYQNVINRKIARWPVERWFEPCA